MKIAIVSDMHIGYERFAEDAIRQAREALEKASELADAIILPGDIFDKRAPKPEIIAQAINLFRDISKKEFGAKVVDFISEREAFTDKPVVAISGTHERTAEGKDNPLNLLGLAGLLVDTSESTTIIEKGSERVAIYGLGGLSEERVKEKLVELDPRPMAGMFSIFMFHQSTYELLPFSSDFIHYDDLPVGFDLYVDGHIHSRVETEVHGKPFIIPGSTVLTQLKDGEQEQKGFVIYDTIKKSREFVGINSRKMFVVSIDFIDSDPLEIRKRCETEIDRIVESSVERPIIKLKLGGTIASGFGGADMPLQAIAMKYSSSAIVDIDSSKLESKDLSKSIGEIRESREGGTSIKELGMQMLSERLKELEFDENVTSASELFSLLSSELKKDKIIAKILESSL